MAGSLRPATPWRWRSLDSVVPSDKPVCYGVLKPGDYYPKGVPLVRILDLIGNAVNEDSLFRIGALLDAVFARSRLSGGEVLLSIQGTIGRVAIAGPHLAGANISRTIARIALTPDASASFVRHWMLSAHGQRAFDDAVVGTTRASVNIGALRGIQLPLPPVPEQRRIAAILDTLDEAINRTDQVIAKLQQMKQGLLDDLLTRGVDQNGKLRPRPNEAPHLYKDSPLGKIPNDWVAEPLRGLCDLLNGLAFKPEEWVNAGTPIIRIQNLNGSREFNFFDGAVRPEYSIAPGTLLFSWSGNRGTSFGPFIWDGPRGYLNQHIFKVTPTRGQHLSWFYYALDVVRVSAERAAHGGLGLVHVRRSDLLAYLVPVPPAAEQARIGAILDACGTTLQAERAQLAKHRALRQGLRADLLTGRVRIRLELEPS